MLNIQNRVIQIVQSNNGIKATDLFARLVTEYISMETEVIGSLVGHLVEHGRIISIEYTVDGNKYTYFVPANSFIKIIDNGEQNIN